MYSYYTSLFQIPDYQGELITFDVVPSKLTFSVNYKSVVLMVRSEYHEHSLGPVNCVTIGYSGPKGRRNLLVYIIF